MELDSATRLIAIERSGILLAAQQEALNAVCKMAHQLIGADASQLNVITASEQLFVAEWPQPRFWRKPVPLSNSGCREVVLAEKPVVIPDSREHPVACLMPWSQDWLGYLGSPVSYGNEVLGSLCVLSKKVRHWSDKDVRIMRGLAGQVGDLLSSSS